MNPIDIAKTNFRAQPIVCASSLRLVGMELLWRHRLDFDNKEALLSIDLQAIQIASILAQHYDHKLRIHCNAEPSSMLDASWIKAMEENTCKNVVVEIVERHNPLTSWSALVGVELVVNWIRQFGGLIALDDVSGSYIEHQLIERLRPEILKATDHAGLKFIQGLNTEATVVIERIESSQDAVDAFHCGATELQGYWCDVLMEHQVPAELTPPGVMARNQMALKQACLPSNSVLSNIAVAFNVPAPLPYIPGLNAVAARSLR